MSLILQHYLYFFSSYPNLLSGYSELINNTEGTTNCKHWHTDDWGGYERVLPPEVKHIIGKDQTQQLERTNGIIRQQIGRWHRRQNKFGKVWAHPVR